MTMDPLLTLYIAASIIAVIINWVVFFRWKTVNKKISVEELLAYLKETKPFPISPEKGWVLHSFHNGTRVWKSRLSNYVHKSSNKTAIYSCYTKIELPAQVVAKSLINSQKTKEWDPGILEVNAVVPAVESNESLKCTLGHMTQWDIITEVKNDTKWWKTMITKVVKKLTGIEVRPYSSQIFQRYWNREENGCCWMVKLDLQTASWTFFLVQPLEGLFEPDHSIFTVICYSTTGSHSYLKPALYISSFSDYITMTKDSGVKLSTFNLPKGKIPCPFIDAEQSNHQSSIFQRMKQLLAQKRAFKRERDIKHANAIFRTKKRSTGDSGVKPDINANGEVKNFDQFSKSDLDGENKTSTPQKPESETRRTEMPVTHTKRSMSASATMMDINHVKRDIGGDLTKSSSMDLNCYSNNNMAHVSLDNYGEVQYRTISNQCAAELLAEIISVSNMDLSSSVDEQAKVTGGWIFMGVEKDVVVMKKMAKADSPQHCYIGKGLIKTTPKVVWDAIKNPRTRFTYDDSLKKVEILHDFKNGMKIVYLYHEVSQLFKRECRDFCFVQGERIEKDQSVLTMQAVEWVGCPQAEDAIRGKFTASGWVIEPVIKDRHIYSMVTYISQINLGSGAAGTLVEEIASKQSVSIAALREYLVPTLNFIKIKEIKTKKEKSDTEKSNTSCTTSEF